MAMTSFYGLILIDSVADIGDIFIALYLFNFAIILFAFEVIQIRPCQYLDDIFRRNFGFLYGPKGKGFFVIL